MAQQKPSVDYMVQLDGIRGLAVCGVILEHWSSGMPGSIRRLVESADLGGLGVECFFVLSGFLITLILLSTKEQHISFRTALGHFYTRRMLRIFPAYYATLLIGSLIFLPMRDVAGWHVLYLSNLYPLWHDTFVPVGGHFWSLAVEEQFYLFWPFVVLLLPVRRITHLAITLCILAPISRLVLWHLMGGIHLSMWTFPTTALDLLAFGALLATIKHQFGLPADGQCMRWLRIVGLAAFVVYVVGYGQFKNSVPFAILGRSLTALFFGAVIAHAAGGLSGFWKWLLGNKPIVWLGTISYGLYLFHPFIPHIYLYLVGSLAAGSEIWGTYYVRYPLLLTLLLLVTASSYYFLEQPIRRFRRRYV